MIFKGWDVNLISIFVVSVWMLIKFNSYHYFNSLGVNFNLTIIKSKTWMLITNSLDTQKKRQHTLSHNKHFSFNNNNYLHTFANGFYLLYFF